VPSCITSINDEEEEEEEWIAHYIWGGRIMSWENIRRTPEGGQQQHQQQRDNEP
jgi:hypothetical protein